MRTINEDTTLEELAALVSQALEQANISATLSGGGAVSIYSDNEYASLDLDFVTSERNSAIGVALKPLGFTQVPAARQFEHPASRFFVEFPPGPLAFGEATVSDENGNWIDTAFGRLRIITPTQSVMDRIAAYTHWSDHQCFDQAIMIAKRHPIDWAALEKWAEHEKIDPTVIKRLLDHINR